MLVPRPGVKPQTPVLQDGFVTTGPPGKCLHIFIDWINVSEWISIVHQVDSKKVKNTGSAVRLPESSLSSAPISWVTIGKLLYSLCLSFLICEVGIVIISIFQGSDEDCLTKHIKLSGQRQYASSPRQYSNAPHRHHCHSQQHLQLMGTSKLWLESLSCGFSSPVPRGGRVLWQHAP